MDDLQVLWQIHRDADWPPFNDPNQGELMTLDTVISGCMLYYLDSPEGLDAQRVAMVTDCLDQLDGLIPGLADEAAVAYFLRLRSLGRLLLNTRRPA